MAIKKKILYVITQGEWGGAQRYVFDLSTNLPNEYETMVAVGEPKGKQDLQAKLLTAGKNIQIFQLRHLVRRISVGRDVLAVLELAKLYKNAKPDIVHLNSSKAGVVGSLAKIFTPPSPLFPKLVYTVHGWVFNEPLNWCKKKFYFYLEKFTAKLKDSFILLNETEKLQALNLLKIPANKIKIIYNGINSPSLPLSRADARNKLIKMSGRVVPKENVWLGVIANFYPTKGLDVLINALGTIKNELADACCIIIGEGPERKKIEKLINNLNLNDKIFLTGTLPEADRLLPAFDALIVPSRKEGLPYILLEAITQKVPIIATQVGAILDLLTDKKTALLTPPDDAISLSRAILTALTQKAALNQYALNAAALNINDTSEMIKQTISWYSAV